MQIDLPGKGSQAGPGCLTFGGLPFVAAGLWAVYEVFKRLGQGESDPATLALPVIFALAFCGVGFGMILYARYAKSKLAEEASLRDLHPDAPWMWRSDWAQGRVAGSGKQTMVFVWAFAIFWNLISAPVLTQVPGEVEKGNNLALLALIFPAVGLGLLIWAIRATARWKKFGQSTFVMQAAPGVIGGRVRGTIETGLQSFPEGGFQLKLSCIRRFVRGSGKNRSTSERVLWQEEHQIRPGQVQPGYRGASVPVDFVVPYECDPTDSSNPEDRILWRLEAEAEVPGVDFGTRFEIPVFKTAESSEQPVETESAFASQRAAESAFDPREATVKVGPSAFGGTEFYFGAARNKGAAIGTTVFLLLWTAATWLQIYLGAPWFFPVLFGLFGVIMFFAVIDLWFSTTRVVIDGGSLRIVRSTLGIRSTKEVPVSEITEIKPEIGMQQTQTASQAGRVYYDIKIHRKAGKKINAGRNIRNKREAEWLAAEMSKRARSFG